MLLKLNDGWLLGYQHITQFKFYPVQLSRSLFFYHLQKLFLPLQWSKMDNISSGWVLRMVSKSLACSSGANLGEDAETLRRDRHQTKSHIGKTQARYAARILANIIVMGSAILARSFVQAYRQALANASRNGVAQEAVQNMKRASKTMTDAEARQILGVTENASWEEIMQRYDNLFERNAKNGSFYLQSKVHRAKECLEAIHQPKEPEEK
ncbi:hypothetical protein KY289_032553 [Solanum tuberosum]|nr:hypothetical protein KY289_032553 [Solanum tuberosum]